MYIIIQFTYSVFQEYPDSHTMRVRSQDTPGTHCTIIHRYLKNPNIYIYNFVISILNKKALSNFVRYIFLLVVLLLEGEAKGQ